MGNGNTHDVIMAGIGGRGVLVAARILAEAGLSEYEHVVWLPSMTTAMRGGPCEATVILSHRPIASPLVWQPQAVVIMEASQYPKFAARVKPGGLVITESAGLTEKVNRQGRYIGLEFEAIATAVALGESQAANLVLLGAYIQATQVLPPEIIESHLERKFGAKGKVLSLNRQAFREGMRLAQERLAQASKA